MIETPLSESLIQLIQKEIQENDQAISFSQFMRLALYHPSLGFYQKNTQKFGKNGDFLTAPEVSPLFAQCIARQCLAIFSELDNPEFLEIGAGSGIFAKEFLLSLEKNHALPKHYYIFEISQSLRFKQQHLLKAHCAHLYEKIIWLEALPTQKINGVIFANEVLDALPFDCFTLENNNIYERCVSYENNEFIWKKQLASAALENHVKSIVNTYPLPDNYSSEINLSLHTWIESIANCLEQGIILLFDYGYGREEYYHPQRTSGTLTCFYQHQKSDNPFQKIGSQDITAHVDFTHVVETATDAGLTFKGFTTQAAFLLSLGLLDLADESLPEIERFQQSQAIKTLTLPSEMGETIKVMALGKDFDADLQGFTLLDRSRDL